MMSGRYNPTIARPRNKGSVSLDDETSVTLKDSKNMSTGYVNMVGSFCQITLLHQFWVISPIIPVFS